MLAVMSSLRALGHGERGRFARLRRENICRWVRRTDPVMVRHFGGRTSEVLNTDAEGRMVSQMPRYANARLRPDVIVDIATLTGARNAGIEPSVGALFTSDDGLCQTLCLRPATKQRSVVAPAVGGRVPLIAGFTQPTSLTSAEGMWVAARSQPHSS